MKALSVRQPWAEMIASGEKDIEYRSWATSYRGPLLICASQGWDPDGPCPPEDKAKYPRGVAVCVVDLVDIEVEEPGEAYDWILENPRRVDPFPVKGKLHLYDVDTAAIHIHEAPDIPEPPAPTGEAIKALTVMQPQANWIGCGDKTVEILPYSTDYRGDLLIISSDAVDRGFDKMIAQEAEDLEITIEECLECYPRNSTICVVTLADVVPINENEDDMEDDNSELEDILYAACLDELPATRKQLYAWILKNPRWLEYVPCRGSKKLFDAPREIVKYRVYKAE